MKILFRNIHLYLSLASGLVIAIVCFTGGVLVFEKELEQAWHPERYFVQATGTQRLPLQAVVAAVQASVPKAKVTGVKVYADPTRTVEVSLAGAGGPSGKGEGRPEKAGGRGAAGSMAGMERGGAEKGAARQGGGAAGGAEKGGARKGGGGEGGGPKVFVNPYTGAVTGQFNYRETFFFTMMALHRGMVGGPIGKLIVGVSTLLFLFIIGTGIVLWWPATGKILRQRLTVKWDASWKRLNHDLHIVLGFYSALFLFVFAFTGLAWSFEWFNKGIFLVTSSPMQRPEPPKSQQVATATPFGLDAAYTAAVQQLPGAESYAIQLPREPEGSIRIAALPKDAAHESATTELYLDQYTGQPLGQQTYQDRNLGLRVRTTFKPVHTGAIFGWPSKIIAFITCLLGVTFPITGVIMWLNRLKKEKKKQQRVFATR